MSEQCTILGQGPVFQQSTKKGRTSKKSDVRKAREAAAAEAERDEREAAQHVSLGDVIDFSPLIEQLVKGRVGGRFCPRRFLNKPASKKQVG